MNKQSSDSPLLEVRGLNKRFRVGGGLRRTRWLRALHDVSFHVGRGEVLGIVGESGSGKSTIARVITRLIEADAGEIRLDGVDVLRSEKRGASLAYRRRVQMVFQDPFGSLNPAHTIGYHLERPLLRHGRATRADVQRRVLELIESVGLSPAAEVAQKHPHSLSGGQRQRIAIARALAVEPDLLIADEPTSMLDVSIRMDVLNLLEGLTSRGVSVILITHDLASARHLADRILVMYAGQVAEVAPSETLVHAPEHPYSRLLLSAVPRGDGDLHRELAGRSGVPRLINPPAGCPFAPRCPESHNVCRTTRPSPVRLAPSHLARCHARAVTGAAA